MVETFKGTCDVVADASMMEDMERATIIADTNTLNAMRVAAVGARAGHPELVSNGASSPVRNASPV
jgi:hypothetical protein